MQYLPAECRWGNIVTNRNPCMHTLLRTCRYVSVHYRTSYTYFKRYVRPRIIITGNRVRSMCDAIL